MGKGWVWAVLLLRGSGTTWCLRHSLSLPPEPLDPEAWLLITLTYHRMESYISSCQLSKQENLHIQVLCRAQNSHYHSSPPLPLSKFCFYPVSWANFSYCFPLLLLSFLPNILACSLNWLLQFQLPIS